MKLTCCCRCFAAACAEVEVGPAAADVAVVSMVTFAETSPLAAAAVAAETPSALADGVVCLDESVGTTKTSGADDDDDDAGGGGWCCFEELLLPSPAAASRLAASLIMNAFFGDVNWPWWRRWRGSQASTKLILGSAQTIKKAIQNKIWSTKSQRSMTKKEKTASSSLPL